LDTIELAEILKNVVLHSVATAFANIVLPVPGGPNKSIPFHGSNRPVKKCGYLNGIKTASFNSLFAFSRPTISLKVTLGFLTHISLYKNNAKSFKSGKAKSSGGKAFKTLFS
jgi:hypothetical protein